MIAGLPMYLRPENQGAHDRLWQRTRAALAEQDIAAPERLDPGTDLWALWQDPDLLLAQTCGLPFRATLENDVALVGAPDHGLPGCAAGEYYSVFVIRADDDPRPLADYARARMAFNDPMSQSGWAVPQALAHALGFQFVNLVQTGAHRASAQAVAEGRADLAAIDAVSWSMMTRWDDFADGLQVIGRTSATPALPYITAHGQYAAALHAAMNAALAELSPEDRRDLGMSRIVPAERVRYLALPIPASPCQPRV
ncbi:phosphate/phosphite/phosphonate ABC transporter substrate-binding protein [Actibacterium ureilyticum]|uniref:phosphate/phosphite/phosphonate ABC transporter substrate-binding protein n=1 Tax=Actibacterium ureilyticum TaxID=1590614 RepID=UPI000BAAC59E|nr:PhnD/SsuA/transferrin family substrate-binding protein [Actibacterium ureilyticum]